MGSELKYKFGKVHEDILIWACNLCILYPNYDMVIHANNIKSCFHQTKHHPNIIGAFSYILANYLFSQISPAFGADFSPTNWEAVH